MNRGLIRRAAGAALLALGVLTACKEGPDLGPCIASHDEDSGYFQSDGNGGMQYVQTTETVCDVRAKWLGNDRILVTSHAGQRVVSAAEGWPAPTPEKPAVCPSPAALHQEQER